MNAVDWQRLNDVFNPNCAADGIFGLSLGYAASHRIGAIDGENIAIADQSVITTKEVANPRHQERRSIMKQVGLTTHLLMLSSPPTAGCGNNPSKLSRLDASGHVQ